MGRRLTQLALVGLATFAMACGNDSSTPVGPDRATSATTPSTTSQAIARPTLLRGPVADLTGTCPTLSFTLGATSVSTTASTTFMGGACATLANGSVVEVQGESQSDGSVVATEVALRQAGTPPATTRGTVASVSGSCPTLSIVVGSTTVTTSASTAFDGAGCGAVATGVFVAAEGQTASDGSLTASRVFVSTSVPPVAVRGTAANVSGTCPALSLTVGTTTVTTTSATTFSGQGCPALVNGVMVAAEGAKNPDGSITATHVFVGAAPSTPATRLAGAVSNLTGSCPALTFTVQSTTVETSASTTFSTAGCLAVAAGVDVLVEGTTQSDGSVAASRVVVGVRPGVPGR